MKALAGARALVAATVRHTAAEDAWLALDDEIERLQTENNGIRARAEELAGRGLLWRRDVTYILTGEKKP